MRCEDVQQDLATDQDGSVERRDAILEHLAGCDACRDVHAAFSSIGASIAQGPTWSPPPGFSQAIARMAVREMEAARAPRLAFPSYLHAAGLGALAASAVYAVGISAPMLATLGGAIAIHAMTVAWTSAGASLGLAVWWRRRQHS